VLELWRALIWQRLDGPGAEYFGLWSEEGGWQLRGTVVTALEGLPARIRYGIICDSGWRTCAVHIALRAGGPEQALHLTVDEEQRWFAGKTEVTELQGCLDVDLEVTPSTNSLPVRRGGLRVGEQRSFRVAWVRFPTLTLQAVDQTYTRLEDRLYRYQSGPSFESELEVDELGLVVNYPGSWQRVAAIDAVTPPA
jgi:hypothetical protein